MNATRIASAFANIVEQAIVFHGFAETGWNPFVIDDGPDFKTPLA